VPPPEQRIAQSEAAAIESLRTIHQGQIAYARECGRGSYATNLMDLATPPLGRRQGFIPARRGDMGYRLRSEVNGYVFNLRAGYAAAPGKPDCNEFDTQSTYSAVAVPAIPGVTGRRSFAINQDGVVWAMPGQIPPAEPLGPPAQPAK